LVKKFSKFQKYLQNNLDFDLENADSDGTPGCCRQNTTQPVWCDIHGNRWQFFYNNWQ
jgi:hypothetical protein